jgi:hypothetical protein
MPLIWSPLQELLSLPHITRVTAAVMGFSPAAEQYCTNTLSIAHMFREHTTLIG